METANNILGKIISRSLELYQAESSSTWMNVYKRVSYNILANTPIYRKLLSQKASDPEYQPSESEEQILRMMYEQGF